MASNIRFVVPFYHYTIMWRTYILLERLLVNYTCTLAPDIIQRYKNVCNFIDYIAFIECYLFIYYMFTEFIRSFTISTLWIVLIYCHLNYHLLVITTKMIVNNIRLEKSSRHDKGVLGGIDPDNQSVEALHGSHVFCLSSHVIRNLNRKYTLLKFHILQIF